MFIGIATETYPGERRVAAVPLSVSKLIKAGHTVLIERGAGEEAGYNDADYEAAGAELCSRDDVFDGCEAVLQVRCYGANIEHGRTDLDRLSHGQLLIGHTEPLGAHDANTALAESGATVMAMELIPRTTRAQSMDTLSSQANLAGYKAVLMAADRLGKIFPMMMTAAGTLQPAKVFVVGAGVAGLQAIATAKRLGAIVSAIDIRPDVKEQVESLGAHFVAPPLEAEGDGGYATELTDEQKAEQQQMMAETIAEADVVITTAAVPGRRAPVLVSERMVRSMPTGSILVDLAAERGGNCELTQADEVIDVDGVTIVGTANIPSLIAHDASSMYANNVLNLLNHLAPEGELKIDTDDEITAGTMLCRDGQIVHEQVRQAMDLPAMETADASAEGGHH